MTPDTTAAFDTIVSFAIPLVALLTSSPMMWRKEHLWNFSVLQRVHTPFQACLFNECVVSRPLQPP
jgi:hypothetical protein